MKKIFVLVFLMFGYINLTAQTGLDVIQSCVTAMQLDKTKSFKTISIKAYLYGQNNKSSIRYFCKTYGEGDEAEDKARLELSTMGKEQAFVFADDEIFQVVPNYEEIDKQNAGELYQIMGWLFPTAAFTSILKDTSELKAIFALQEGTTKFNDKSCKKIAVSSKEKPDEIGQYLYFDEVTNWFQGLEIPSTDRTIGLTCSDFKKKTGYVYPTIIKILSNGKKMVEVEIEKLEADIELDDALFQTKK